MENSIQGGTQRVNRKKQQAAAGNWGHPRPYTKKHTNIPEDSEIPKHKKKAKKKKEKKEYKGWRDHCPFCGEVLLKKPKKEKEKTENGLVKYSSIFNDYEHKCRECGAKQVEEPCPACKSDCFGIWKNKEGTYKHMTYGCGFEGKKKRKPNDKKEDKLRRSTGEKELHSKRHSKG